MQKKNSAREAAHAVGVRIKSIKKIGKADVYCLSAIRNGNMIANGIITSNCDALRYVIATHKVDTYKPYKDGHNADDYLGGRFNQFGRRL